MFDFSSSARSPRGVTARGSAPSSTPEPRHGHRCQANPPATSNRPTTTPSDSASGSHALCRDGYGRPKGSSVDMFSILLDLLGCRATRARGRRPQPARHPLPAPPPTLPPNLARGWPFRGTPAACGPRWGRRGMAPFVRRSPRHGQCAVVPQVIADFGLQRFIGPEDEAQIVAMV